MSIRLHQSHLDLCSENESSYLPKPYWMRGFHFNFRNRISINNNYYERINSFVHWSIGDCLSLHSEQLLLVLWCSIFASFDYYRNSTWNYFQKVQDSRLDRLRFRCWFLPWPLLHQHIFIFSKKLICLLHSHWCPWCSLCNPQYSSQYLVLNPNYILPCFLSDRCWSRFCCRRLPQPLCHMYSELLLFSRLSLPRLLFIISASHLESRHRSL